MKKNAAAQRPNELCFLLQSFRAPVLKSCLRVSISRQCFSSSSSSSSSSSFDILFTDGFSGSG